MSLKCPYCSEDMNDRAYVCKHCGRDLIFIRPLLDRISTLEDKLDELSLKTQWLRHDMVSARSRAHEPQVPFAKQSRIGLPAALLACLFGTLCGFGWTAGNWPSWTLFILALLPLVHPLPFGLLAGLRWEGSHLRKYGLWGAAIGLLYVLARTVSARIGGDTGSEIGGSTAWGYVLYFIASILSFTAGGVLGDWVERKRTPHTITAGLARRIAKCLIPDDPEDEKSTEARVQRLALLLSALQPIIVALLSLLTACVAGYFQWRATGR